MKIFSLIILLMIPFLAYAQNEGNKDSTNVPVEKVENKAVPNDTVVNEDSVPVVNVQVVNSGRSSVYYYK